jgi:hypothetical protein
MTGRWSVLLLGLLVLVIAGYVLDGHVVARVVAAIGVVVGLIMLVIDGLHRLARWLPHQP